MAQEIIDIINELKERNRKRQADIEAGIDDRPYLFKKGEVHNPNGKPKGSKQIFSEKFVKDISAHWSELGMDFLDRCIVEHPAIYAKIITAVLPKVIKLDDETREAFKEAFIQKLPFEEIRAKVEKEDSIVH